MLAGRLSERQYWATRAGCGDKIGNPHDHSHTD